MRAYYLRCDVVVQAELKARQQAQHSDHRASDRVPLEVKEEPTCPSDDAELIEDAKDNENDKDDDGDEASRLFFYVTGCQTINGDPIEGHLL